jgi:hypothetical protein
VDLTDKPPAAASDHPERSKATSRTIWLSLGGIALVGGTASYLRALGLIQAVDGRDIMAIFEAALADPTIAAASVNIVDAHRQGSKVPKLSILSIAVAAVVTLGANVMSSDPSEVPKWLVNVWPPLAFLLAFESLMSYLRRGRAVSTPGGTATRSHDDPCPHGVAGGVDEAVRQAYEHERDCEGGKPTFVDIGTRFGLDRKRVAELVKPAAPEIRYAALNGSAS